MKRKEEGPEYRTLPLLLALRGYRTDDVGIYFFFFGPPQESIFLPM